MKISDYLNEIEHAVITVISEIHSESVHLDTLRKELATLTKSTEKGYYQAELLSRNPDFDDDFLGTSTYTYFGVDKERFTKSKDVETATQRATAHEFSISSLSGSILQYGKQGISLRFGKYRNGCPDGRILAGMTLHEVIWQARNQALHWEDGSPHSPVVNCFTNLASIDPVFNQYASRNLAYEVILLLGWKSFNDFHRDMMLFNI